MGCRISMSLRTHQIMLPIMFLQLFHAIVPSLLRRFIVLVVSKLSLSATQKTPFGGKFGYGITYD